MTFIERISQDIATAMRARDTIRLGALRMAKAALMNREIEKGAALEEGESRQVMASLIKQRRDSIEQFRKGGRDDLADKEAAEITTLETYLPPALDEPAIDAIVDEVIQATGAGGAEGSGTRDEGGHAPARRSDGGRQAGERNRPPQTWGLTMTPNFSPRVPSNHVERHAQASHPSSIRLLSRDRSLFFVLPVSLSTHPVTRTSASERGA